MSSAAESLAALDARFPGCLVASIEVPAREATYADWPEWVPTALRERYAERGIERPWAHQVAAAVAAHAGSHVLLATPTASGKSLGTGLAALSGIVDSPDGAASAIYISPTKALAADQLRALTSLGPVPHLRIAAYDGDTSTEDRRWARAHASFVLTTPDMLHLGLLGAHERWARLLRGLTDVIVDECHLYRGVFGSHMGNVLRRLLRVARHYRAEPRVILASATAGSDDDARAEFAARLVGEPVTVIAEDTSPHPGTLLGVWNPPLTGAGSRSSAGEEAAAVMAELVHRNVQTLTFTRSRAGAEWTAMRVREQLAEHDPGLAERIGAYRGGYLPEERRALEADLRSGQLRGIAATSALELGIDVAGIDAVLTAGWPGSRASIWQQAGRSGRAERSGLALFIARDDPLDQYLASHPDELDPNAAGDHVPDERDEPTEAHPPALRITESLVCDPQNPHVLGPHLLCAAAEVPLTEADLPLFGSGAAEVVHELTEARELRRRPTGWYRTQQAPHAAVSLRSADGAYQLVEQGTGRLLGTVDSVSALRDVHAGAVYVHQGRHYLVQELRLDDRVAILVEADPPYFTRAFGETSVRLVREVTATQARGVRLAFGDVQVTSTVDGFRRMDRRTGRVLGEVALDLPPSTLRTTSVWWTVDDEALWSIAEWDKLDPDALGGAAHAAEHASIGLLPLLVNCDRSDIGGLSTPMHPDTGLCSVFVYDGTPGGAGYAEHAFQRGIQWLGATAEVIAACPCDAGCPSCVQSPKCGSGNEPLSKDLGVLLLSGVVERLRER